ncbi:unnamed protein product [Closterium sp. Naga37s-1]|nr:unnamed protein product [Closterium sp. Naga37s-1]
MAACRRNHRWISRGVADAVRSVAGGRCGDGGGVGGRVRGDRSRHAAGSEHKHRELAIVAAGASPGEAAAGASPAHALHLLAFQRMLCTCSPSSACSALARLPAHALHLLTFQRMLCTCSPSSACSALARLPAHALHLLAFQRMLFDVGFHGGRPIDETFFRTRISGRHNPDIGRDLFPGWTQEQRTAFLDEKEALFKRCECAGMLPTDSLTSGPSNQSLWRLMGGNTRAGTCCAARRQLVLWREGGESEGEGRTLHVGADHGRQQEQQQQPMGSLLHRGASRSTPAAPGESTRCGADVRRVDAVAM